MRTPLDIFVIYELAAAVHGLGNFPLHGPVSEPKSFWRLPCRGQSGIGRLDPLVQPGQISAHVHTIAGGNGFGFNISYESLNHSTCTSCAIRQDKSAYWTPTLNFMYANGSTVMVEQVGGMLAYYKSFPGTVAFPEGFRMIAGDPNIRNFSGPFPDVPTSDAAVWKITPEEVGTYQQQFFLMQRALGFNCLNYNVAAEGSLYRHQFPTKEYMDRQCVDGLRLELAFPSCGNGSLDSLDHSSHMKYPSLVQEGICPSGYPIKFPLLFFETIYNTWAFAGIDGQFLLSYGDPIGTGFHGDFVMGWESEQLLQNAMDTCRSMTGQVKNCPLFNLQSEDEQQECHFSMPDALMHDNPTGPRNGLAVDVPIQYGPQQATSYPVAGQNGTPTKHFEPSEPPRTFIGNLSIHPYGSDVNPTLIVGATGGGTGRINFAPLLSKPVQTWMPAPSPITYVSGVIAPQFSRYLNSSPTTLVRPSGMAPSLVSPPPMSGSSSPILGVSVVTSYETIGNKVVQILIKDEEVVVTIRTKITVIGSTLPILPTTKPMEIIESGQTQATGNCSFNTIMWIFGSETKYTPPSAFETSIGGQSNQSMAAKNKTDASAKVLV